MCVASWSQILSAMARLIYRAVSRKGSLAKEVTQAELAELSAGFCHLLAAWSHSEWHSGNADCMGTL